MARTSSSDIDRITLLVAPLSAMMMSHTASSGSQRRSRAISSMVRPGSAAPLGEMAMRMSAHESIWPKLLKRRQSRRKYWGPIVPPIRNDRNQSACLNLSQSKPWGSARSIGLIVPCATTMLRLILRR